MVTTESGVKVRFTHFYHFSPFDPHTKDEDGIPGQRGALRATDVVLEWPDGRECYGIAYRIPEDNPDKAVGRSIALDRATANLPVTIRKEVWSAVAKTHKIRFPKGYKRVSLG